MDALRVLPGVGARTAQRMAFHLLERDVAGARKLVNILDRALDSIRLCNRCRMLTEHDLCQYCISSRRDSNLLCVVKSPADALAIEQSATYFGQYFVLHGHLSPIEGIGPQSLGVDLLVERIEREMIEELILATHPTAEGDTTAHYISECLRHKDIRITRISRGVPTGGELEYVDSDTLGLAMTGRREFV